MRRNVACALCIISLATIPFFFPSRTSAASISGNAIRISPAISNVQLKSGQTSALVPTTVTNLTSSPLSVVLSSKDFGALNESGTVGFYGKGYNPSTNPHSLESVMSFLPSTVYLEAHDTQKVNIILTGLNSLAAGGHFGAALFTPGSPVTGSNEPNVSIRSSLASLVFLVTATGGTQQLQLLPLHLARIDFSLPSVSYIGFHNNGNTQAAVRGQVTLFGPNGNIVSTTVLNPGSGLVLPGTSRVFSLTLPYSDMQFARPGIYRMELQYRSDSQSAFTVVNRRFYFINLTIFIPLVLFIILIIYLGKWHGKKVLKTGRHVARKSAHVAKKLGRRKQVAPSPESPKKQKPRRIQG